ncbi:receptor kinase-like protein Xa21 [Alnus glutinosa]|uniref:receptor kinase-like protein Xa21 n=1 Tax=Alnus glutinosa TaxID=3517 RepID=UPI002D76D02C|nr:receptor kinase-like protein Xa21 [Alnus glutinosa]
MDNCHIKGSIPRDIGNLSNLITLELQNNELTGPILATLGRLQKLQGLESSRVIKKSISIPTTISGLKDIANLLTDNELIKGLIPESFGALGSLEFLDLSCNNLSREIPMSFKALSHLKYLNVSFNRLRGKVLVGGPFVHFFAASFMSNDGLCGALQLQKNSLPLATWRRISQQELLQVIEGFSANNLLGGRSFGSVYQGTLFEGMIVAIKVFNLVVEGAFKSFDTKCEVLRNIRHRNLVKIISTCSNIDFEAFLLEYMPNGNLENWLYSQHRCLNILQRLNIMIDITSALEYLHYGYSTSIVHCDLKPNKILLDGDMVAHVADFGIAKLLGDGDSMMRTVTLATIGYMALGNVFIVQLKLASLSF